jgi:DNA-binding LytR/AlgR family response regulator
MYAKTLYNFSKAGDKVKIRIEIINDLEEDEVLIRCPRVDDTIEKIHHYILEQSLSKTKITFYKKNQEFYFPLEDILFFETEGERIYAHTSNEAYTVKYRLYELESILPRYFVRAAKSAIVNIMHVYSITRNITASSLISFNDCHKHVYVSRAYYSEFKHRLDERSNYEK